MLHEGLGSERVGLESTEGQETALVDRSRSWVDRSRLRVAHMGLEAAVGFHLSLRRGCFFLHRDNRTLWERGDRQRAWVEGCGSGKEVVASRLMEEDNIL